MPKDIEKMIKDDTSEVVVNFKSDATEFYPTLSEDGTCFYLTKRGMVEPKGMLAKLDETEGSFTIPDGYIGVLKPIIGEVQLLPSGEYQNYPFNFSMKGHSFFVGTVVATIYLLKLEKIALVKTE
jgi:hypothetical protein